MLEVARYATLISSVVLRIASYVFLRWIPGHPIPPLVLTTLAIYIPTFLYCLSHTPPYRVISDEVDIVTSKDFDHKEAMKDVDPRYANDVSDVGEEITVEETVVVTKRDPERTKCLLTGLPSPSSLSTSILTFTINVLLALMVLDYTYRTTYFYPAHDLSFARVGYVSDTTASFLVREPDAKHYPLSVSYRLSEAGQAPAAYQIGKEIVSTLDNRTDFTARFFIDRLKPDTRYEYFISNNHTGSFVTSPKTGHTSNRSGRRGSFTFLHTSCLKNNFPYNPFAHPLSNAGLRYLGRILETIEAQFMIFLGDFIYIDVPKRHGFSDAEDYRREYRQIYASPDWPAASKNLPWIHVYDDHEIANDWDKNTTGFFPAALDPYDIYHTSINPPLARHGKTYFQFTDGPATFFMLDTRRYRSPNQEADTFNSSTGEPNKSMLGKQQRDDLLAWLAQTERPGVRWKIVISSVPFTQNWHVSDGASDIWRSFLIERQIILEAMWDVGARGGVGVVILSGDRHEFAATAFPPPPEGIEVPTLLAPIGKVVEQAASMLRTSTKTGKSVQTKRKRWPASAAVMEYSCSPLNMFYLPIRTYKESSTDPSYVSDVCVKYIPDGNSKFGAVTISSTSDQSVLLYRLYVDGKEKWSHTITTPPETGNEARNNAIWG